MSKHPLHFHSYSERGQLKIYQRTLNSAFSLSNNERLVLLFILERTVRWKRAWEYISEREFSNGVFRRQEGARRIVVRGTRLSAEAVDRAIASLRQMGAIETDTNPAGKGYRINENWRHPELISMGHLNLWDLSEGDYEYDEGAGGEGPPLAG